MKLTISKSKTTKIKEGYTKTIYSIETEEENSMNRFDFCVLWLMLNELNSGFSERTKPK